jgi:hypothetical protein
MWRGLKSGHPEVGGARAGAAAAAAARPQSRRDRSPWGATWLRDTGGMRVARLLGVGACRADARESLAIARFTM